MTELVSAPEPPGRVAAESVRRQDIHRLTAAVLRALTGENRFLFRGQHLHKGQHALAVTTPHLVLGLEGDAVVMLRGAVDSIALREQYSDPVVHAERRPPEPVARLLFELLEQLRVESLVAETMPGSRVNLHAQFEHWSRGFHRAGGTDSAIGILIYTVCQICWSRLNAAHVLAETEDFMEATRAALAPVIGSDLMGLRRHRHAQDAYAPHALSIARCISAMVDAAEEEQGTTARAKAHTRALLFALQLDVQTQESDAAAAALGVHLRSTVAPPDYQVLTTQFDRIVVATTLVRAALLQELRAELDSTIAARAIALPRLVRHAVKVLAVPQPGGWDDGQDTGYIDGRRLAQLVSAPTQHALFRLPQHKPQSDCLVSFLIDCSGSMRTHSRALTLLLDLLVRAFDMAGVTTEVLGFTTGAWHGGRARKTWLQRGSPSGPGRLNELCHLIFKDAKTPWRRARTGIAALLKADLFREGIDGEAIDWACTRMAARSERRQILVVVSDGSPTDGATSLANDPGYLEGHLTAVVARHERGGNVELCGLGVGFDLTATFTRCLAIDLSIPVDSALCHQVITLIGGRVRRD